MRRVIPFAVLCGFTFFLVAASPAAAQEKKDKGKFDPPKIAPPSEETLQQIAAKTAQLAAKIAELRKNEPDALATKLLPDVEIYLRAAQNIVRFKEFYSKDSGKWTLDCLDRGLMRAEQLAKGKAPWTTLEKRNVLRAYRSVIDDTAQPYGVTYPLDYGKDPKRKWRVDVVLHGRGATLTEVAFINSHNGNKKVPADQDWVQIDIFGRGNNAYRWAGEMDVIEAMLAYLSNERESPRESNVDHNRILLRGFSVGGAGTWHLGLHYPSWWCVMGPGAGFTTTHGYAWPGKKELPDYQERCLRIYDAVDYVENARMIPIIAYSGGADPQKLAADNIENRLKELKIDAMTHLVAPGLGHTFPAEWFKKANERWSKYAAQGREDYPQKISFMTYSLKYSLCNWLSIDRLERHYDKATVNAERTKDGFRILTNENVRGLHLHGDLPRGAKYAVEINGQKIGARADSYYMWFVRRDGKWKQFSWDDPDLARYQTIEKRGGIQGPIDDAFASGFVCVTGTGETWHPATQKFVDAKIKAFEHDWAKHWRGELPITNEYGITPNEIMEKHLILFGDPSSNFLLANILPKLPLKWTKDEIEFAGKKYKAGEHVPVMIFPNPLNPSKYVVLNTGHTFPSEAYNQTNAMLYPRLGDYAILRLTPTAKNAAAYGVATAGLFDEFWKVEK